MAGRNAVPTKSRMKVCSGVYPFNGLADISGVRLGAMIG